MSFEFDAEEQLIIDWPVTINVPASGGKINPTRVTVKFLLLDSQRLKSMGAEAPAKSVLQLHVKGWGDEFVNKKTGEPLAFTDANLDALLAKPWIQRGFSLGLVEASSGAAAKNS
jgi:hypothetical protein